MEQSCGVLEWQESSVSYPREADSLVNGNDEVATEHAQSGSEYRSLNTSGIVCMVGKCPRSLDTKYERR